jgi:hypothetical protein
MYPSQKVALAVVPWTFDVVMSCDEIGFGGSPAG